MWIFWPLQTLPQLKLHAEERDSLMQQFVRYISTPGEGSQGRADWKRDVMRISSSASGYL